MTGFVLRPNNVLKKNIEDIISRNIDVKAIPSIIEDPAKKKIID